MISHILLIWSLLIQWRECGLLFQSSSNISKSSFSAGKKLTTKTESSISCAHRCLHFSHTGSDSCNSYSYNEENLQCELASLTFLEDPLEDGSDGGEQVVMVEVTAVETLPRVCRGGEHCCRADQPCAEGEGDCNSDGDCEGVSVCGQDNCAQSGGRWDVSDDCCERRCSPARPCREGQGHCHTDQDCHRPGWARCGDNLCLNSQYFPLSQYPNNSAWFGFSPSDNCCYRYCNKLYRVCGHGEVGCSYDEDCAVGHHCDTDLDQPTCLETDECDSDNTNFNGTAYCGIEATCTNSVGSFSCPCVTGFTQHTPWVGCRDINECTEGGNLCKQNTDCWNWYGTHNCSCKAGFTGDPHVGCTDIDECAEEDLNTCAGGLDAAGLDVDVNFLDKELDDSHVWVDLGEPEDDGYSQAVEFYLRSQYRGIEIQFHGCNDTSECPQNYGLRLGAGNGIIWKKNGQNKKVIAGWWVMNHLPHQENFKAYTCRQDQAAMPSDTDLSLPGSTTPAGLSP